MMLHNNQRHVDGKSALDPCECYTLELGGYFYALMITAVMEVSRPRNSSLVSKLVTVLHYREKIPPDDLGVFESRRWMRLYFGQWAGQSPTMWCARDQKFEAISLIKVGEVARKSNDPFESPKVGWWDGLVAVLEEVSKLPEITSAS